MAYSAKILLDSVSPAGSRLTSLLIEYPRFVHAELMTHRVFSRSSASSRAIPIQKMIERVMTDPVIPVYFGKNQSGMQAREELEELDKEMATDAWLRGRDEAVHIANKLVTIGAHKQIVNRVLEPWLFITVIVTATEWDNFFALRCHPDAQPELQKIAYMMRDLYHDNKPVERNAREWHLPLVEGVDKDELELEGYDLKKIAVARCARVSYLRHDGVRDPSADIILFNTLLEGKHLSPFEHVAEACGKDEQFGNFTGWRQLRKTIPGESGRLYIPHN